MVYYVIILSPETEKNGIDQPSWQGIHHLCVYPAYINQTRKGEFMGENNKRRMNIYLSEDTIERLKQYAWENHTSVSHAITE